MEVNSSKENLIQNKVQFDIILNIVTFINLESYVLALNIISKLIL